MPCIWVALYTRGNHCKNNPGHRLDDIDISVIWHLTYHYIRAIRYPGEPCLALSTALVVTLGNGNATSNYISYFGWKKEVVPLTPDPIKALTIYGPTSRDTFPFMPGQHEFIP